MSNPINLWRFALVLVTCVTSPVVANNRPYPPTEFAYMKYRPAWTAQVNDCIYSDELQLRVDSQAGGTIGRITAFGALLAEGAHFRLNGKSVDIAQKDFADCTVERGIPCKVTGTAKIDGLQVPFVQEISQTPEGLSFSANFDSAKSAGCHGVFTIKLVADAFKSDEFRIGDKTYQYKAASGVAAEVTSPTRILLSDSPKRDVQIDLRSAGRVAMTRTPDGLNYLLEISTESGRMDFVLIPPYKALAAEMKTDHTHNIFSTQETGSIRIDLGVKSNVSDELPVKIKSTVTDYYGRTVLSREEDAAITPGNPLRQTIAPKPEKKGFYLVQVDVTDKLHGDTYTEYLTFAVMKLHPLDAPLDLDNRFGIWPVYDPVRAEASKLAGMGWTRTPVMRAEMETEAQWDSVEQYIDLLNQKKLAVMGLDQLPPDDLQVWRDHWRKKAQRFAGKVAAWEVLNEIWTIDIKRNVELHRIAMEEIKKADPKAIVIANILSQARMAYLKDFLEAGGADTCDVIASHPYPSPGSAAPEVGRFAEHAQEVRTLVDKYRPGMPIWWTEWGWMNEDRIDFNIPQLYPRETVGLHIDERLSANYMVRSHLIGFSEGIEKFFYFRTTGKPTFPSGVLESYGVRPVYCAYNTMTWMLGGREYAGKVMKESDVYAMAFSGKDGSVLAYWHGGAPEKTGAVTIPLDGEEVYVADIMDNPETPKHEKVGITIPIDSSPRYIVSKKPDVAALLRAFEAATVHLTD